MKQHIKKEQLNELSDRGKEKLAKWEQDYDEDYGDYTIYIDGLPLLSIGQMIEFLEENSDKAHEALVNNNGELIKGNIICDALWEAVKQVLEND